ncbi:hypothetical protein ACMCNP_01190 [Candidatus Acidulodesulfobacterium sp. H_13]|uniref:hypothetical protein n=1 Tax=Candidatus Acidulodesulfobacterium sp. H_13 TaxID=3395470 RepID=UPI003AF6D8FF
MIMIEDAGMKFNMTDDYAFDIIPAHYLHSPGQLNLYDPVSKILFSGDIGAALVPREDPKGKRSRMYSSGILTHTLSIWSISARDGCLRTSPRFGLISKLDVEVIMPQHGLIFKGKDMVNKFLNWFDALNVGLYYR